MANFLDETGLSALWEKIKTRIATELTPYVKTTTMNTALATKLDGVQVTGAGNVVSGASVSGTTVNIEKTVTIEAIPTDTVDEICV